MQGQGMCVLCECCMLMLCAYAHVWVWSCEHERVYCMGMHCVLYVCGAHM